MADFHFSAKTVKRSAGQSSVASAAYISCEKLHDDYYDEIRNYSNKPGLVYSEILLPPNAPEEYKDRQTLWNSVEFAEPRKDAQLAHSFNFSLMNEFTIEENIEIAHRFIQENFVDRGMICDWAFHFPTEGKEVENPHIHLLCPTRPLNDDGTWGDKRKKEYEYDDTGQVKLDEDGKEVFKYVYTTDWFRPETLVDWREKWAKINNEYFEKKGMEQRVSSLSYEKQGIDKIPTIHEGPNVRAMEDRGTKTAKGNLNRAIRAVNKAMKDIVSLIAELIHFALNINKEKLLIDYINDFYKGRMNNAYSDKGKSATLQTYVETINFMKEHKIHSSEDLLREIEKTKSDYESLKERKTEIKDRIKQVNNIQKQLKKYEQLKPVYDEYKNCKFNIKRNIYYKQHQKEIDTCYAIQKKYEDVIDDEKAISKLSTQITEMKVDLEMLEISLGAIHEHLEHLNKVKYCYEQAGGGKLGGEQKERDSGPEQTEEKPSIIAKVEANKEMTKEQNSKSKESIISKPYTSKENAQPKPQEKTSLLGRVEANKAMIKEQQEKKIPAKDSIRQER